MEQITLLWLSATVLCSCHYSQCVVRGRSGDWEDVLTGEHNLSGDKTGVYGVHVEVFQLRAPFCMSLKGSKGCIGDPICACIAPNYKK